MSKYPTTMSCREAFDQLTSCYSVGGQFRNYYRYGEYNPCSKQLAKFKFCIMNSKDPVKVQEWYKEQIEYNKEYRGSSDDIWEER
ncbi:hypothetical protein TPHA_0B04800 [Tetrapisispora phaffii CBS 4417]|uniref:Early meiotic induction protein 1 n=1 Tax=Tetrapisispora phaffii (strain ATCC 24235 / CBS 4417 / NBRC 1672 / NRRL Y-8282 / UCD 70-5) TaxID=1071381 RepID=G8BQ68_TETPH|nr:hypothetical protein TPHA_0B04800 [Tetrapisispora phaffii CBS 4417]CCE62149.1 hypothetical protein TPHA_0B04800 [Tetrapisispora phaffii CBS 4417]